ncbi:IS200/IS605 family transposase [Arachidicoccus soli]|uniref:IS200/IS605 family transposase n=1 Tax=Arachidicoccus soli TaxID=2341117 RepID=A0A386HS98_9BACT|nr:IS200/IS605 family transposase [Arachidicoccus soli]AYD48562.1 IS200/IS605 family transposase [Arachidicoccus soli]
MSQKTNYISTNRSKHYLKCPLISVCKYRKAMLVGQLNDDVKRIFLSIAENSDFEIEVMETDTDHVHFLIRYIPRLSIVQIVRRLKQESTRQLWLLHGKILRKQYWYQKLLWSDGYFVCSIGEASPETVRQYILSQG